MADIWRFNVAVTNSDWFRQLSSRPDLEEVNFWQPRPSGVADKPGTPWLFKLHSPQDYIVGGGFFTYYAPLPIGIAWNTFELKNGVESFEELLARVSKYRKVQPREVDEIGCVILGQPFFFAEKDWIPIPSDWSKNIVKGKHYELSERNGSDLWQQISLRLQDRAVVFSPIVDPLKTPAFGKPLIVTPRLGQGSFRLAVLDAYDRRCAVTGERTLPALDAAHIKPFTLVKAHDIDNGLSLRSDIHRLYDQGYVSVRPDGTFAVSKQIREEFENGRDYYALHNRELALPANLRHRPNSISLEWHYSERFRG